MIFDRIIQIREHFGLSQKEFAEKLSVQRSSISEIESGKRDVSRNIISALVALFDVSADWLLTGEGEMFRSDVLEKKALVASQAAKIPLLRQSVSCGPGQEWQGEDNVEAYIEPLGLAAAGKSLYAFRSRGVSMIGVGIQDGDVLIFDGAKDQALSDDLYVFGFNGEAYCKLLRFDRLEEQIRIFSAPVEDLKKIELVKSVKSGDEGFQIFGRVLCWIHENRLMWR